MKIYLLLATAILAWSHPAALAAPAGPEKATELLAQAWMIDNRCTVLDREARKHLTGFVARAEISLAEKRSIKVARAAIAKGRAAGAAASCNGQNAQIVRNILAAAKSAAAISDMDDTGIDPVLPGPKTNNAIVAMPPQQQAPGAALRLAPPDAEPMVQAKVKRPGPAGPAAGSPGKPELELKPKRLAARKADVAKVATARSVSTAGYAQTAEAYYRELRCRGLSQQAVNAMYARVLREHRRAVASNGKSAVRQLLRAAKTRAAGRSC